MPTPREIAKSKGSQLAGEPKYCGVCGLPDCDCGSSSEASAASSNSSGALAGTKAKDVSSFEKKE